MRRTSESGHQREKNHGTQSTEIFEEGVEHRRTRDEEAQGRHLEERPLRPHGQEPQAGDRDRPFRGAGRGREAQAPEKESREAGPQKRESTAPAGKPAVLQRRPLVFPFHRRGHYNAPFIRALKPDPYFSRLPRVPEKPFHLPEE